MSTSSTGKTVNYNEREAATTCGGERGAAGGGHAKEGGRKGLKMRGEGEGKGRKRNAERLTTTGEIQRATLVGARVCPCIHPCTPGGGDRRVLISPPPSLVDPPLSLRAQAVCTPVAAPATFPHRHSRRSSHQPSLRPFLALSFSPDHPNFTRTTGDSDATDQGRV